MRHRDTAATFASALRRFQRRLRVLMFARHVPVACAITLGAVNIALLAVRPGPPVAALACAGALVFAILAAFVVVLVRMPSLAATARVVDQELRLENRAVTALQFSKAPDAISRLVVADATSRLEMIPASLLPLRVSARSRWVALTAMAASALIVVGLASPAPEPSSTAGRGEPAADGPARPGRSVAQGVGRGDARTGDGGMVSVRAPAASQPAPSRARDPREGGEAQGDPSRTVSGAPAPTAVDGAGHSPERIAAAPDRRADGTAQSRGTSAGGGRGGEGGDTARRAGLPRSAAGRGAPGAAPGGAAGGGVGGGALVGPAAGTIASDPTTIAGRDQARYRRAYARAEVAMNNARVPPRLRLYVRDYFLAIRPEPGQ